MFANGGERVEPTLVDRVQDRWGRTIYRHDRRRCPDCTRDRLPPAEAPTLLSDRERVMDPITAYQLTSMMQGVVQRGTAAGRVTLGVPAAGKTGTTNDARDVWFVGFTSTIVAGCYMGYDRPEPLGRGAGGGSMCAPVFNDFMARAVELYGGGSFKVPEGGHFVKIDRFTGERLPDDAAGPDVVAELFRDGEEPLWGMFNIVDGGFAMGSNLPLFSPGEGDIPDILPPGAEVVTSDGERATLPTGTSFGSMTSGGLY
jgi:penicillin-binding protein 1A